MAREYFRDGKRVLHSTSIVNYLTCPHMMYLAEKSEFNPTEQMTKGLLLEGYLFGFKDDVDVESLELGGLKRGVTPKRQQELNNLQSTAKKLKSYFPRKGEPFKHIEHEGEVILVGEVDYYTDKMLYDLKLTASIDIWKKKNSKADFMQAIYYPYIIYKETGKILPFKYVIYPEDTGVISQILVTATEQDFEWIEDLISTIAMDPFCDPVCMTTGSTHDCFNQTYGKCRHRFDCSAFKEMESEVVEISFGMLA